MVRWRLAVALSTLGLSSILLRAGSAQTSPAAGNPPQAPGGSAAENVPTYQVSSNLVLVDVVVRDRSMPVEGLRKSDFQVLEAGKPQTITIFEEHKGTDVEESAKAPLLPPHVYSDFPKYSIKSAANVLLLDALNTQQNDQISARAQMLKYLHTIPAGTQIAVFTLASRLRMISGFTADVGAIEQALNPNSGPTKQGMVLDSPGDVVAEKQIGQTMSADIPEMDDEVNGFQRDRQAFQDAQRMGITLGAFSELARYLSTVPGRKNLIWVSGGLSGALDPSLSRMNASEAARFAPAVRTVNAELTRARVAVYPVDARAQMTLTDSNISNVVAPTESGTNRDLQVARNEAMQNDVTTPQQWAESQQEMKLVAADTGGKAYYNTNAVGKAVAEAIADGENYYTLGYAPSDAKNDGAYRTITVRIEEGKYDLAYRRGYFAVDPNETEKASPMPSPIAQAMEHGIPPLSQVIFETRVLPAGDPDLHGLQPAPGPAGKPPQPLQGPVTRYFVDYSIDPHQLALKNLPGGKQQAELEVA
jgi:VWFA-related protein